MDKCFQACYAECGIKSGNYRWYEPWERLASEGQVPQLQESARYKVYTLRSQNLGAAMSLVFTHDDETFISVSICISKEEGGAQSFLQSKLVDRNIAWKLKFHGELNTSIQEMIRTITKTWKAFGDYKFVTNNCQDFVKATLKEFNLPNIPINDRTYVGGLAGVATAVGTAVITLLTILNKK